MIDLETMGISNNAPIMSIGACFFDPKTGEIGNTFHEQVNLESANEYGATFDPSTIIWWMKQEDDARSKFYNNHEAQSIHEVLTIFNEFITKTTNTRYVKPWGNGATFDLGILSNAYYGKTPWMFYNERDVRTIVDLGQSIGFDPKRDMPFDGIKHDALADAIHQAKYVSAIWQLLTGGA